MASHTATKRVSKPESGVNGAPPKKQKFNEDKPLDGLQYGAKTGKSTWWQVKKRSLKQNSGTTDNRAKKDLPSNNRKEQVNWKQLKERKKALKQTRKQNKFPAEDIIKEAKRLYETVKAKKMPKKERGKIVAKIYELLKGCLKEIIYKHDMTRIAQLLIKLSSVSERKSIWSELKPEVSKMMLSKYAIHTVRTLLDVGGLEIRREFTPLIKGSLLLLLKNKVAAPLVDRIYKNYALPEDRSWMRQEVSHFTTKSTISTLLETLERKGCYCPYSSESKYIENLVQEIREEENAVAMISAKTTLEMLIEKNLVDNSLVQSILSDYLMKCSSEDREQFMKNLQPILQNIVDKGLDSFYAVILCMEYLWFGSNKEKKWLVKKFHAGMPQFCLQNHSYFLIIAIFECVDDTVLLKKTLLKDILTNMKQLADNTYGWKVLMHILTPRNPRHFSSSYVSLLKVGDNIAIKKKSDEVRNAEILEPIIDPLLEDIAGDPAYWMSNGHRSILAKEAICASKGTQLENVLKTIAEFVCCQKPEFLNNNGLEFNRHTEWLVKQLIKTDIKRAENGKVTFSSFFLEKVTQENVKLWVSGRAGAIIFVKLIETGIISIQNSVKCLFQTKIKKLIDSSPAGELLRIKLQEMQSKQLTE